MPWITDLPADRRKSVDAALTQRGARYLKTADGDRDFAAFLLVADSVAYQRLGVSIFDLDDYTWRAAHEAT
jgi:hypothetical protein